MSFNLVVKAHPFNVYGTVLRTDPLTKPKIIVRMTKRRGFLHGVILQTPQRAGRLNLLVITFSLIFCELEPICELEGQSSDAFPVIL